MTKRRPTDPETLAIARRMNTLRNMVQQDIAVLLAEADGDLEDIIAVLLLETMGTACHEGMERDRFLMILAHVLRGAGIQMLQVVETADDQD